MRIGIDARFMGPSGTGLGKYTEKLLQNLSKIDTKNDYFIFLKKENWDYLSLPKNFSKILADVPWYSLKEQIKLPAILSSSKLDILHVPHFNIPIFYKGKIVVTIHDLIHHQFPQESATTRNPVIFKAKRSAYKITISRAIKKSQKILAPSENTKKEILKLFKIDPSKIVVTYEAAEEEYFKKSQKSKEKSQKLLDEIGIKKPFIVYVGNAYPHKNLANLLKAQKTMNCEPRTKNLSLLLVCSRDVFWNRLKKQIQDQKLEEKVILEGYLPSARLRQIFKEASVYVFPSLAEGFGIPGLNAMASGLPVVCSDIPTLREIYQDAPLYFDPKDPNDIAKKIQQIGNPKIAQNHSKKGIFQVKKYSWEKMAKETLSVYSMLR